MSASRSFAWLDLAARSRTSPGGVARFSQRQVEEVKLVLRMLPIFFTTILYWTIYMQVRKKGGRRGGGGGV